LPFWGQQPAGRWFKSNPRHQDKAKGSDNAPLQFLGPTTHTKKTWQRHPEKKLGPKPLMDNGFGGKEYEAKKNQTTEGACLVYGTKM